jgi:hypothetical protein
MAQEAPTPMLARQAAHREAVGLQLSSPKRHDTRIDKVALRRADFVARKRKQ